MNGPVKLRDFIGSEAARSAKAFNDRLRDAIDETVCPDCRERIVGPHQLHECRRQAVNS